MFGCFLQFWGEIVKKSVAPDLNCKIDQAYLSGGYFAQFRYKSAQNRPDKASNCVCVCVCLLPKTQRDKMKRISLKEILEKLEFTVNAKEGGCETIPYKLFMRVLMMNQEWPCLTSERTVREKYKTLIDLGILSESGRIDFDSWNVVLGR